MLLRLGSFEFLFLVNECSSCQNLIAMLSTQLELRDLSTIVFSAGFVRTKRDLAIDSSH